MYNCLWGGGLSWWECFAEFIWMTPKEWKGSTDLFGIWTNNMKIGEMPLRILSDLLTIQPAHHLYKRKNKNQEQHLKDVVLKDALLCYTITHSTWYIKCSNLKGKTATELLQLWMENRNNMAVKFSTLYFVNIYAALFLPLNVI